MSLQRALYLTKKHSEYISHLIGRRLISKNEHIRDEMVEEKLSHGGVGAHGSSASLEGWSQGAPCF